MAPDMHIIERRMLKVESCFRKLSLAYLASAVKRKTMPIANHAQYADNQMSRQALAHLA
jgi:hypothetical protein